MEEPLLFVVDAAFQISSLLPISHQHMHADVPSPIDLRLMSDAREWEQSAMSKRPWRAEVFARFASEIGETLPPVRRVLDLGSGPGFLAEHLLDVLPDVSIVLLDFSSAMHELARARLGERASRVTFVARSFRDADCLQGLGAFDCVVTNQAVHELRRKRHAVGLHRRVRDVLSSAGSYLVGDHFFGEGGLQNDQLYMSVAEQRDALIEAGFSQVEQLMLKGSLVLHRATQVQAPSHLR